MAHKILIVDDDVDQIETLRLTLEASGFTVVAACDGAEGREKAVESKPDLILLDVMMQTDTDGFDLAYALQSNPVTKDIPIIMQTSLAHWEDYLQASFQAVSGGPLPVKQFLEKPIATDVLLSAIREVLK